MECRPGSSIPACEKPPDTRIGGRNQKIRNEQEDPGHNRLVEIGDGLHHLPKILRMHADRRKTTIRMLHRWMETGLNGFEILQHSRI